MRNVQVFTSEIQSYDHIKNRKNGIFSLKTKKKKRIKGIFVFFFLKPLILNTIMGNFKVDKHHELSHKRNLKESGEKAPPYGVY